MTGFVGIEEDYPVSIKEVLNITAETGAFETQCRVRELPRYEVKPCEYIVSEGHFSSTKKCECSVCGDTFNWADNSFFLQNFNYCRNCGRKIVKFVKKEKEES